MDLGASSLFISLFVSTVGLAVFVYGKKQRRVPHLAGGVVLMVVPYFLSSALATALVGAGVLGGVWLAAARLDL